ncbi:hypothetical protein [Paenibacillus alvei]|uniref:hypothetical protein n=1 Tax=Paenibacillus alvei TaxID=44250 RepID=UPI0013D96219|nr:hypothetical protein [Paenibacillus alvei]NEZ45456.1 hypothetical protein [Paenibacillus alvei]
MNKSVTSFVTIAGEILEQNVSIIEKIESKIKISRFISRNLFLGVSIAFIIGYIYIFERYIPDYYVLGFLVPLVFLVLFMLIINKTLKTSTGTKKLLIDKIFIYAYSSSLETIIIFAFYYFVKVYMKIGLYAFIIEYYPSLLFILPLFV